MKRCGSLYLQYNRWRAYLFQFLFTEKCSLNPFIQNRVGGGNPENVWGTTTSKKSVSHSVAFWLCNPMDCSLPGSSVHGILQARILEWIAIHFSRAYDFYTRYLFKACESWIKEDTVNGIWMITDIGILLCYSYLSPRSSNSPSAVLIDNAEKFNDLLLNTKSFSSFWFYI